MRTKWWFKCTLLLGMIVFGNISLIHAQKLDTLWLQSIDLGRFTQDWDLQREKFSNQESLLKIAGKTFENGLSSHTEGLLKFEIDGRAERFHALIGLDDVSNKKCSVSFKFIADNEEIFKSPVMEYGKDAIKVELNLEGVHNLSLIVDDNGSGLFADRADYADAYITYVGTEPVAFNFNYINKRYILTPPESPKPRINGAKVFGVRPGHPFLYTVAATGIRPMTFAAENLPEGLSIDSVTGIITGVLLDEGETLVTLRAINELGTATREFKIVAGDRIALTPPLGWNGYNRYADSIDHDKIKASVDAMVNSGLINHGWTYINIDDSWSIKPGSEDTMRMGVPRNSNGLINANKKFPDMNELTDYIHSKGLKAGLYSSPGPLTCSGYTASYQFEDKDALQWANWGFDYIKYDWCTYGDVADGTTVKDLQKPYVIMRNALNKVDRDIVFSMSQYGMGDVWEWGEQIGGNCWRTSGDLIDTWQSVSDIGFNQAGKEKYAGPGHWNDPDMLVVGLVGWGTWKYPSRLKADEQYTHISLWSLLAAPLLIGCDLIHMDAFTKNLFTNHEVIDINQDPLGKQAVRMSREEGLEIWVKELEDGSKAVGLFNRNSENKKIKATWETLELKGKYIVRDVWRQVDEGVYSGIFTAVVPAHGVKLITLRAAFD